MSCRLFSSLKLSALPRLGFALALLACTLFSANAIAYDDDLVWQNTDTGQVYVWKMRALVRQGAAVSVGKVPTEWKIATTGDFNGDSKPDIVWQNALTGQRNVWYMDGATRLGDAVAIGKVSVEWNIAGTGDFDADGKTDILWNNLKTGQVYVWLMDGVSRKGGAISVATVNPAWTIEAIADFDADGRPDIVWQNSSTGQINVWLMNGVSRKGASISLGRIATVWDIAGAGDFDQDGKTDIAWQNKATGQRSVWFMDGLVRRTTATLTTLDPSWTLAGIGNFEDGVAFDSLVGVRDGIATGKIFTVDSSDMTISTGATSLTIKLEQFFDGTCIYTAPLNDARDRVGSGTFNCSDFTTGSWQLFDVQRVEQSDVFLALSKDGSMKRAYGMSSSTVATARALPAAIASLAGSYEGLATGGPFGTEPASSIQVTVIGTTLQLTVARFYSGTCQYSATIQSDGRSVSGGTYQCSDFTSGAWSLLDMRSVGGNDLYVVVSANGNVRRAYGLR